MIAAVDVGFGRVKAITAQLQVDFPAVVGDFRAIRYQSGLEASSPLERLAAAYNGNSYFVGEVAKRQSTPRATINSEKRFLGDEGMVLLLTALSQLTRSGMHNVSLVLGLPVNDYARLKDKYKRLVTGIHRIRPLALDGSELPDCLYKVEKAMVMPQPFGTLFNRLLDSQGKVYQQVYGEGKVGIVDIGYHTVDLAWADQLDFIDRLSTSFGDIGLHSAYQELSESLSRQLGIQVPIEKLDAVIDNRAIKISGQAKNVGNLVDQALSEAAGRIVSRIRNTWPDVWELDKVIITGGGAQRLGSHITPEFGHGQAELHQHNGIYTNVSGYFKFGIRASSQ